MVGISSLSSALTTVLSAEALGAGLHGCLTFSESGHLSGEGVADGDGSLSIIDSLPISLS